DLRSDDADQNYPGPIDAGDVAPKPKLEEQRHEQKSGGDEGRLRQPEADVVGEIIRSRLADRRTQDLDHPEVEGDLGNLVQHPAQAEAAIARRRHRGTVPAAT